MEIESACRCFFCLQKGRWNCRAREKANDEVKNEIIGETFYYQKAAELGNEAAKEYLASLEE